jgi:CubicO group peptidase (beta-lactamase class C family)
MVPHPPAFWADQQSVYSAERRHTDGGEVNGYLAPGFGQVGDVFEHNFREHGEIGAAFAAVLDGKPIVDIWAGVADRQSRRPWNEDSLQLVFSGTKGLVATCILMLIDRQMLDLEERVSRYWPDFGKPHILVRDVVAHTARLPGIDERVTIDDLLDDRRMSAMLARQKQSTDPRAAFCYHALTYGWLCGELVRRVDGRSVGQFFAEEVASPLALELWIGLPASAESRVTTMELSSNWGASPYLDAKFHQNDGLLRSIWGNPEILSARSFPWNRVEFHRAEIPGVNAIGTARSIAKLYDCLACGGRPLLTERTVRLARETLSMGHDSFYAESYRFGVGFQLQTDSMRLGPPPDAFGHGGAGGSVHGAWPTERVGYSYAMNCMVEGSPPDPRGPALLKALYTAVHSKFRGNGTSMR